MFGKLFKILFFTATLLFIVAIGGVIYVTNYVDPNSYKDAINEKISKLTDRPFVISGQIDWSFFPWLGFNVNDISMDANSSFGDKEFLQVKSAKAELGLMPLLSGKVVVKNITLDSPSINLVKLNNTTNNWQDLVAKFNQPKNSSNSSTEETDATDNKLKYALEINHLRITNAKVNFIDKASKNEYKLSKVNLTGDNINLVKPFSINLDFNFDTDNVKTKNSLKANVKSNDDKTIYQINNFNFTNTVFAKTLPSGEIKNDLKGNIEYSLKENTFFANELQLRSAGLEATGQAKVILDNNFKYNGELAAKAYNPTDFLTNFGNLIPFALTLEDARNFSSKFKFFGNNDILKLSDIYASLFDGELFGNANVYLSNNKIKWDLNTNLIDLNIAKLPTDSKQLVSGFINLESKIAAVGVTKNDVLATLTGDFKTNIRDGQVNKIDILYYLQQAKKLIDKNFVPTRQNTNVTNFGTLTASGNIINGIVENRDLLITGPDLTVKGKGKIELPASKINYSLEVYDVPAGGDLTNKLPLALTVYGDLDKPKVSPNIDAYAKAYINREIDRKKDKVIDKAKEKLEEKIGDKLGDELKNFIKF